MATPIPHNHAAFTLGELRQVTGGRWLGGPPDEHGALVGICTDTRALQPGQGFVAIAGEQHDGHAHLAAAARGGAAAALVERESSLELPAGLPVLLVGASVPALGALGAWHLGRWRARGGSRRVVAITGSAGKTTTRQLISVLLGAVEPGRVHATRGNLNNLIGVPMVALGLGPEHHVAVLELGTSRPGEIATLCAQVAPDLGVLTLVASAHGEGLGDIEQVAAEKTALLRALGPEGIAIGNGDDPRVAAGLASCGARRCIRYGFGAELDYRIVERRLTGPGSSWVVIARPDGSRLAVELPLLGRAGALGLAAALATCESLLGRPLSETEVGRALAAWPHEAEAGRLCPRVLGDGVVLIDDSYNSNPASCRASMAAAAEVAAHLGRELVLVLGEMRELGAAAEAEHRSVGREAAGLGVRALIAVGGLGELLAGEARRGGVRARFAVDAGEGARLALDEVRPGDVVLVKGSRGVHTEQVARALLADHEPPAPTVTGRAEPRPDKGQAP